MALSRTRASQIMCTGTTIFLIGDIIIGLCHVLGRGKYHLGSVFENGAAFWAGIPVAILGIVGILAGTCKKNALIRLFLLFSILSLILGVVMSSFVGLQLKSWRSRGDCSYTYCPFDEVSILLIVLLTACVLLCILSVTGIIEAGVPVEYSDQDSDLNEFSSPESRENSGNSTRGHIYSSEILNRDRSYHTAMERGHLRDDSLQYTAV